MIYSTVNFVIPVKKYWIGERKGKRIESLLVQTCPRFPMQLSVAKMALENSFSPITKTLVSIDRITSSRILASATTIRKELKSKRNSPFVSIESPLRPSSIHLRTRILERNISSDTWSGDAVDRETANRFDKKGRGREDHVKILLHAGLESQRGNLVF